jgi:hypothetical protein
MLIIKFYAHPPNSFSCKPFIESTNKKVLLSRRRYGTRRIAVELKIGRASVRAAMQRENLKAIAPRKFKPKTTDSNHDSRISPNLLKDAANAPAGAGEVIVGDITYIRLADGSFCYLEFGRTISHAGSSTGR